MVVSMAYLAATTFASPNPTGINHLLNAIKLLVHMPMLAKYSLGMFSCNIAKCIGNLMN